MASTNTIPKAVKRFKIADYYSITGSGDSANYELMGTGFEQIDESPNAQVDKVHYDITTKQLSPVSGSTAPYAYLNSLI